MVVYTIVLEMHGHTNTNLYPIILLMYIHKYLHFLWLIQTPMTFFCYNDFKMGGFKLVNIK